MSNLINYISRKLNFDANYFLRGGFWMTLGQFFTILFGIATTSLFAYYLNATDYGVYKYLIGLIAIFSSFSLTGLGQSILQTAAKKYYGFYKETLTLNLLYSSGIVIISLSGSIYYYVNNNNILSIGCVLIAITQPVINSFQYTPSYLQGIGQFKKSTTLQIIRTAFASLVSMTALYFTKNIIYLFLFYQIGQIVVGIASYKWYVPKESKSTPHDIYNKYISYSKHTSVRNIISNISSRLDIVIIFTQLGAADLALYSIATIIPEQIKGTFKNLGTLLLPKYSNHKDIDVIKRGVPKRSFQLLIALIIITILYIIISPYVYSLLFPKYPEAIFYSMLSALSFPSFIALIPISVIQSSLDKKTLYMTNLQDALIGTILIYALTISYGITGTILARVITRYINVFYLYNKLTR